MAVQLCLQGISQVQYFPPYAFILILFSSSLTKGNWYFVPFMLLLQLYLLLHFLVGQYVMESNGAPFVQVFVFSAVSF